MFRRTFSRIKNERGQAFMELAISLVFLLILLSAMIDLGWAFYTMISLRDAAQEAAVYGAMCPNHPDLIRDRLRASADSPINIADIPDANIHICVIDPVNPPDSCETAPVITPQLRYGLRVDVWIDHTIHTPFIAAFIGRTSYPLAVDVTDTIMRVDDEDCLY